MNPGRRLMDFLRPLFAFSRSERRGILWLLPLLAVLSALIVFSNRPSFEESFTALADVRAEEAGEPVRSEGGRFPEGRSGARGMPGDRERDTRAGGELFPFDPNTVTFAELCRLGFDKRTAAGIVKYRAKGKRFEIPEDFATCYGVSLADFRRLEPFIEIGEKYRARGSGDFAGGYGGSGSFVPAGMKGSRNSGTSVRGSDSLFRFDPDTLPEEGFVRLGFSPKQAVVIVRYRESRGGFRTPEELAECYVVSERKFAELRPYMDLSVPKVQRVSVPGPKAAAAPELVELNTADSAALRAVRGIGAVLVVRIMERRERLGGFVRKEQLAEIPGMTEANYELICKQIYVDSCVIRKIDINFASPKELLRRLDGHPYLSAATLRKILKYRQLKGGWDTLGEMVKEHILTQEEAARLAPYLSFRTVK